MNSAAKLKSTNTYSHSQILISKLLIATMLLIDLPFFGISKSAQAETINPNNWVTVPVKSDPMMQGLTIPANAATQGMWSGVQNWPLNGLHAAVLPNGNVLTYGTPLNLPGDQNGRTFDSWDPSLGFGPSSHSTSTYAGSTPDSFCTTSTYLSNGNLLVTGGNGFFGSTIYSPSSGTRTTLSFNLAFQRWYATMINLPDGRPLVMGGMWTYAEGIEFRPDQAVAEGSPSMTPEVLETNGWRSLFGATSRDAFGPDYLRTSYPRAWVAPNGLVFGVSSDKMWYLDPTGNGTIPYVGDYKRYNDTTIVNAGSTNTAVMYAPGKILIAGGNGGFNADGRPASNQATVIDINSGTPILTEQPNMANPRRMANSIVLANGQVVVTGGSKLSNNDGINAVFESEIWTPSSSNSSMGTWQTGASASIYRGYHSTSVLMPNGTILNTGGGAPGPVNNLNAQIYYPPYLFRNSGGTSQLAARPVIKAISGLSYDNNAAMQMDMESADPISQLVLIGLSQTTHAFNAGQRRIPLTFSQDSFRLSTTIPNSFLTPPGYYQVVALDAAGVPSLGAIIAIGQNQTPPAVPTNPYTPPNLDGIINAPVLNPGGTANYNLTAVSGVTYSWNFGDGTPSTPFGPNPSTTHTYTQPGLYVVTLSARDSANIITTRTFLQAVATPKTTNNPSNSTPIIYETRPSNSSRVWVVNPDNDSVSVIDTITNTVTSSINVGTSPRTLAIASDGRIWVANKESATISIISPTTLSVVQTIALPRASQPHGLAFAPAGGSAYVALEATGQLIKLNPNTGALEGTVNVGKNPRHIAITADASKIMVSRFITPPLPGESTATINVTSSSNVGAEVIVVNPSTMTVTQTVVLHHSDKGDSEIQGSGIPNYLGAASISPDGTKAWIPSKQDNIKRGMLRNSQQLDFQNTVRAISSRIDMDTMTEDYAKRIDHDNSSVGTAAVYHPSGVYMFVALETSRQVAVVDAIGGNELFRIEVGRAPQGLAISPDGNTLYVQEFMDRSVSIFNLSPLTTQGRFSVNQTKVEFTVDVEKLPARVVIGKQLFYDAKDSRLARDSYMSCASCHNDAGNDGRVWDLTGFGEGLRNTISLRGRAGMGHGFLHWSANFDEVQDFEKQIRDLAGGTGLMPDAQFNSGTVNQPLGTPKAGLSTSLDDLAVYLTSLTSFVKNPNRNSDGSLTAAGVLGEAVFNGNCASCHSGPKLTDSFNGTTIKNIGTIKPSSGQRLNSVLTGIDVPTLLDAWSTAPYLHDGSANTLTQAIQAHSGLTLSQSEITNVLAYIEQLEFNDQVLVGTGLRGQYYSNRTLTGAIALERVEPVNFNWAGSPGPGIPSDNFSVRWSGQIEAPATGAYQFRTNSDDGVRVYVNGQLLINNWTDHAATIDTSSAINLVAGQRYNIIVEFYDSCCDAVIQLSWRTPNDTAFSAVPASRLYSSVSNNVAPTVSLTAPTANAVFTQGTAIAISANAADSDGTINQVQFFDGTTLIGSDSTAPYSMNYTGAPLGARSLTAVATDNSGASTTSTAVNVTVNATANVAPTVSLTAPTANAVFTQGTAIAISANAADSDGTINQVQFFDGTTLIGSDSTAPYSMNYTGAPLGARSLTAVATDNSGASTTSAAVNVTVNATANVAPTVSLTAPTANAVFTQGTAIAISANAADSDGTINQVQFFDGTTLIGSDSTAPYSMNYTGAPLGARSLTAVATDNSGASTTSAAVNVTVNLPGGVISARYVRLTALSEVNGNPWASAAEVNILGTNSLPLNRTGWVATASSQETAGENGAAANAIDGDVNTIWHTVWSNGNPPHPHQLILDMRSSQAITALTYLRRNGSTNGTIRDYEIHISNDGVNWGTPIASGTMTPVAGQVTTVNFNNTNSTGNVAPTVSLTAPTANAVFTQGTAIAISANAADSDGTINQVQFFDGTTLIGSDSTAPYSMNYTGAPLGARSLTAVATDNSGASTTSAAVNVTVNETSSISGTGTGLSGQYFANKTLTASPALQRVEAINFNWAGSPGPGIPSDNFSVRWSGQIEAPATGAYQFRTNSDDGVRVYVNGQLLINNWTDHAATIDTSSAINLVAGQRYNIIVEFYDSCCDAVIQLSWRTPNDTAFSAVPASRLYQ